MPAAGVLVDFRPGVQGRRERTAGRTSADANAARAAQRERQTQIHRVEEDAIDAADVGVAGIAVRRAPAVMVVFERERQLHPAAARVEVIPGGELQDRRVGRPERSFELG